MGEVIDLKTRQLITNNVAEQRGTAFVCTRCEAKDQLFKLFSTGDVHCGDCGARMTNLKIDTTGPVATIKGSIA